MELKDFIKGVVSDIANAVRESQAELAGSIIIAPANVSAGEESTIYEGQVIQVSEVAFEVAVAASSSSSAGGRGGLGVSVLSAFVGGEKGSERKEEDTAVSRVRFSIPIAFLAPPHATERRSPRGPHRGN